MYLPSISSKACAIGGISNESAHHMIQTFYQTPIFHVLLLKRDNTKLFIPVRFVNKSPKLFLTANASLCHVCHAKPRYQEIRLYTRAMQQKRNANKPPMTLLLCVDPRISGLYSTFMTVNRV